MKDKELREALVSVGLLSPNILWVGGKWEKMLTEPEHRKEKDRKLSARIAVLEEKVKAYEDCITPAELRIELQRAARIRVTLQLLLAHLRLKFEPSAAVQKFRKAAITKLPKPRKG